MLDGFLLFGVALGFGWIDWMVIRDAFICWKGCVIYLWLIPFVTAITWLLRSVIRTIK